MSYPKRTIADAGGPVHTTPKMPGLSRALIALALVAAALLTWPRLASAEDPCKSPAPPDSCYAVPPEPSYDAQFVSQSVLPTSMPPGHSVEMTVNMRNTGNVRWRPGAFKLGSQSPQDNLTWGISRVQAPSYVAAGATATFKFRITAPSQPGTYTVQWQMLEESVRWFGARTPAASIQVKAHRWSLTEDFRPNYAACELGCQPMRDHYGNQVWGFLRSPSLGNRSPSYNGDGPGPYLSGWTRWLNGIESLECWRPESSENSLPAVCNNFSEQHQSPFGIDWPAGQVMMHPSPVESAVVAWRSPYFGTVRVTGSVRDLHKACGDGVRWTLWLNDARLASATLPDGGATPRFSDVLATANLEALHVDAGDRLYLEIDPRGVGDHGCDSTGVELNVDA